MHKKTARISLVIADDTDKRFRSMAKQYDRSLNWLGERYFKQGLQIDERRKKRD